MKIYVCTRLYERNLPSSKYRTHTNHNIKLFNHVISLLRIGPLATLFAKPPVKVITEPRFNTMFHNCLQESSMAQELSQVELTEHRSDRRSLYIIATEKFVI
jgi:hypothetical protein